VNPSGIFFCDQDEDAMKINAMVNNNDLMIF